MIIIRLILLYFFLFQPLVISREMYLVVLTLVFFSVFLSKGSKYLLAFKNEIILVLPILCYPLFLDIYNGQVVYSDRFLNWFLQSLVFSIGIVQIYGSAKVKLLDDIILVSFFGALITFLSFNFAPFERFVTGLQNDPVFEVYSNFEHRYRAHGFSQHLNFSYGVLMGFMAGVCLFLGKFKFRLYAYLPFMLFAAFVNARTGVIVFFVFLILYLFSMLRTIKSQIFLLLIILSLAAFLLLFRHQILDSFDSWYFSIFSDILSLLRGEPTGTIKVLFSKFMVFPETFSGLVFGTGESIYLRSTNNSDVGFVLQIYYAGLFFTFYLYLYMFYLYSRIGKVIGYFHWFSIMFMVTFLLMNIKGFFFAGIPGTRFLFLIYVFFIANKFVFDANGRRVYVSR